MLYKDDIKRKILQKVKEKIEDIADENELLEQIFSKLEGTNQDKENLFIDCKAYLFLNSIFENNPEIAIKLAEKYLSMHNNRDINLVDEKLLTFYMKTRQNDRANELIEKLLIKEPDNKWTLSKKINMLRIEGKYDEALQLIQEKYEVIKHDPIIFDIQYKILCKIKKDNVDVILDFFETRIPNLNFGSQEERIRKYLAKLTKYTEKTYQIERIVKDKEKLFKVRKIIKQKRKEETKKIDKLKEDNSNDLEIVKQINRIMLSNREKINLDKVQEMINKISDKNIAFFMSCQIQHATGNRAEDIAKKVKNAQKNTEIDEQTKKIYRMLQNFLTSKDARFYLYSKWIDLQKLCLMNQSRKKEKNSKERI